MLFYWQHRWTHVPRILDFKMEYRDHGVDPDTQTLAGPQSGPGHPIPQRDHGVDPDIPSLRISPQNGL
jgi:hypothetical protein